MNADIAIILNAGLDKSGADEQAAAGLHGMAAGGLLGLYPKTPGMRREGGLRPSQEGIGISKDVWLLGIGLGLVLDELGRR